jgi:hypothetical protein
VAIGSRFNAHVVDEYIELLWTLYHNGTLTNAYAVSKVEIFDNYDDALTGTDPIQTIIPPVIINVSTGVYKYNVTTPEIARKYYDKVTFTPESGMDAMTTISAFYVGEDVWSGAPVEKPLTCTVSGYILNEFAIAVPNAIVTAQLLKAGKGGDYHVMNNVQKAVTDEVGFFALELIRSTEFTPNIQYELDIRYGSYHQKFLITVPNIGGINFIDLLEYT